MDPLGATDPLGRIESRKTDDDLRIPAWPTTRQETLSQAPAQQGETGIMSRAFWNRLLFSSQQAKTPQEDQTQDRRIPPPTPLKP